MKKQERKEVSYKENDGRERMEKKDVVEEKGKTK